MSYFALNDVQDEIQAQSAGMVTYRLPSYGVFSTTLQPQYWFGVPRNTTFSGLTMDVDAVTFHGVAKSGDRFEKINFTRAIGARLSAMEHLVPEQMFSTDENPAHGISAVKALAIAAAEGQKIWTITQDNLDEALAAINLGVEVESEIRNSVLAGNVATAHEDKLAYHGWAGSGYLLIDSNTGAGAYKISGGTNGGFLIALPYILVGVFLVFALQVFLVGLVLHTAIALTIISGALTIYSLISGLLKAFSVCADQFALAIVTFLLLIKALIDFLVDAVVGIVATLLGVFIPEPEWNC